MNDPAYADVLFGATLFFGGVAVILALAIAASCRWPGRMGAPPEAPIDMSPGPVAPATTGTVPK